MGEYEELVELGIEGVDKAVDKYHDRAFDKVGKHSPAWHRRHDGQQQQERKRNRNPQPSESSRANHESYRKDHETSRGHDERDSESDMYAPDRRQERDYQERRDVRYVSDETVYYRGPDAGAVVMRGSDPYNKARGHINSLRTTVGERATDSEGVLHPRDAAHRGRRSDLEGSVETPAVLAPDLGHDRQTKRIVLQSLWLEG
ncbi:uncharacterized protein EKO05_0002518 [Ascochyta rabiei]|uniref:uncharacterized protein n=1 Tax=Didymella rabiei TaxID=5454 RepID=UPI00220BAC2D|nr:uncharacterized protein EKO05_0002518 [Ascochyta rabiei]UPX11934.1 hypothetical protein EKO05_0002518 [Ascochyta rabiei]